MMKELTASDRLDDTDATAIKVAVIIPNWNGAKHLRACIDSILKQTLKAHIVVVDNGSVDESVDIIQDHYSEVSLIRHAENLGYAGGVNPGFRLAIERDYDYAAPFNNDAVADKRWLEHLVNTLQAHPDHGIATCKLISDDGDRLDSTGDYYTSWGLPYPRGRNETDIDKYDRQLQIFGASGGASLYRVAMLKQIGLFDEDFFAYYEDVDLSFRAQWAGWKVRYVPASVVYHATSSTGKRMRGTGKGEALSIEQVDDSAKPAINGFFTYQTMKNLPMLLWKNVPSRLLPTVLPRFALVYLSFFAAAIQRHQLGFALRGAGRSLAWLPKKLSERRHIMRTATVSPKYIASIITYDLPPNARRLRKLRAYFRRQGLAHDHNNPDTSAGDHKNA